MKPPSSIRVVKMWCDVRTDPILRCFDNPEGLNCEDLLVGVVPELSSLKLANSLRLGTVVLSQDLSGAWVTIRR
jgi:hypothetical protein